MIRRVSADSIATSGFATALGFCGTQDLLRFENGALAILISVASFQEVTRAKVSAYLDLIDAEVRGVFYRSMGPTLRSQRSVFL